MIIGILISLLLAAAGTASAGIVDGLAPFQTYFFVDVDPIPHDEFRVHVETAKGQWWIGETAVTSATEAAALTPAALRLVHANFTGPLKLLPPESFARWPAHHEMILAINYRLRQLYPESLRVSTQFVHRYQRLLVTEVVPFNEAGTAPRLGTRTRAEFRRTDSEISSPQTPGSPVTNSELFPAGALKESTFLLDYKLPANLDGMPFIESTLREGSPARLEVLTAMMTVLAAGRRRMPDPTTVKPSRTFEFGVDIYGRSENSKRQFVERVQLPLSERGLREGTVDSATVATKSQVSLRISGGLTKGLVLDVRDVTAKLGRAQSYAVTLDDNEVGLAPSPDPNVMNLIRVNTQQRPFSAFDVYPQLVTPCRAQLEP